MPRCTVAVALASLVVERLYAGVARIAQSLFAFTFAGIVWVVVCFCVTVRLASSARASTLSVIVDCDVFVRWFGIFRVNHPQHNLLLFQDCTVLDFVRSKTFTHATVKQHYWGYKWSAIIRLVQFNHSRVRVGLARMLCSRCWCIVLIPWSCKQTLRLNNNNSNSNNHNNYKCEWCISYWRLLYFGLINRTV